MSSITFAFATVGPLLVLLVILLRLARISAQDAPLPSRAVLKSSVPTISILIPARNEAKSIGALLKSLRVQSISILEILVFDDASTDGTADVAEEMRSFDQRIRVLRGGNLPATWTGKNRALDALARAARGRLLLFVDADTYIYPNGLAEAWTFFAESRLDGLSLLGRRYSPGWFGAAWDPVWLALLYSFVGPLRMIGNASAGTRAFASGAFLLVEAAAYWSIGGHSAAPREVVEDCAIFQRLISANFRVAVRNAPNVYDVRMYSSVNQIIEGWSKNVARVIEFATGWPGKWAVSATIVFVILCTIVPMMIVLAGATGLAPWPICVAPAVLHSVLFAILFRCAGGKALYGWTYPAAGAIALACLTRALTSELFGRVQWKGRTYINHQSSNPRRASWMDVLLARLDDCNAPSWMTLSARIDEPPPLDTLRDAVAQLIHDTPRLRISWDEGTATWVSRSVSPVDGTLAVQYEEISQNEGAIIAKVIRSGIDLSSAPPLRVTLARLVPDGKEGAWLFIVQLHHAIGDALALRQLVEHLWWILQGRREEKEPLAGEGPPDRAILVAAIRQARWWTLVLPRYRICIERGIMLPRDGDDAIVPTLMKVSYAHSSKVNDFHRIFMGSILSAVGIVATERQGIVRLRIPVDVRRALGLQRAVLNGCSVVAVEVSLESIRNATGLSALADLALVPLRQQMQDGAAIANALEGVLLGRIVPRKRLRGGALSVKAKGRTAATLVLSYLGRLDSVFQKAPFVVYAISVHTPRLGAIGFTYRGHFVVNFTSFAGLWSSATMEAFVRHFGDAVRQIGFWEHDRMTTDWGEKELDKL